jgi:putative oxidoreductase
MTDSSVSARRVNWLNIALWTAQILLAVLYGMAAYMKATQPLDQIVQQINWVADVPAWLPRFIGIAEGLGALGLILPSLTRILPGLTPLAAAGLSLIQLLAMPFHLSRGEASVLPVNLVLLALSLFILWGRWKKAPIAPR